MPACSSPINLQDVADAFKHSQSAAKFSVAVAVDGSSISDKSAMVAAGFTNVKRGDTLSVLHVSDRHKTNLPRNLQPTHLHHFYEDMIGAYRTPCRWVCKDKDEGQSTCESLMKLATNEGADLLVLGSFGRKGEKLDMLGSVSDFSLRSSHASVCIVRSSEHKIEQKAKFMFACDGSHASAFAFCFLVFLIVRPQDTVDVVFVTTGDGTKLQEATAEEYRAFMLENGIKGAVHLRRVDVETTIPQGVNDAVIDLGSDVLVLGISGYGSKKLGSVSEAVSIMARVTTIIVKDRHEVMNDRFSKAGSATVARQYTVRQHTPVERSEDGTAAGQITVKAA